MGDNSGEIIARFRRERGLTQEQLAEGICDPANVSRYENGTRIPSKITYQKIMEKLGVFSFSYAKFMHGADYECEKLRREILDDLAIQDTTRMDEMLFSYNELKDDKSVEERQFYETATLIWHKMYEEDKGSFYEKFLEILSYTRPNLHELLQKDMAWVTYEEKLIANNIGLALLDKQDPVTAMAIFRKLILFMENEEAENFYGRKGKAVLYNNLALCCLEMGNCDGALMAVENAFALVLKDGGGYLWIRFLRTKAAILGEMNRKEEQEKILRFIKEALVFTKAFDRPVEEQNLLLESPLGISVL